jgi:hypothetical protein
VRWRAGDGGTAGLAAAGLWLGWRALTGLERIVLPWGEIGVATAPLTASPTSAAAITGSVRRRIWKTGLRA